MFSTSGEIKTIQHVKFDTPNVWLAMCLSNLLLEQFFILEEDWLPLLEIHLLLKRSEAATVTHAFKVSSSSVQVGFKWSVLPEVLSRKNELAWTNEDHAYFSARAALNTRTHLQFLVLFFSLVCSSPCLMICKTSWEFCGVQIVRPTATTKPCHVVGIRNSK